MSDFPNTRQNRSSVVTFVFLKNHHHDTTEKLPDVFSLNLRVWLMYFVNKVMKQTIKNRDHHLPVATRYLNTSCHELTSRGAAAAMLIVLEVTATMTQLLGDDTHCKQKVNLQSTPASFKKDLCVWRHVWTCLYQAVRESRAASSRWRDACRLSEGHLQSWATLSPLWETPLDLYWNVSLCQI